MGDLIGDGMGWFGLLFKGLARCGPEQGLGYPDVKQYVNLMALKLVSAKFGYYNLKLVKILRSAV